MSFKTFFTIVLFFLLYSCSPQWHIQKSEKHKEKAINKGAILTNDTTYVFGDTIIDTHIKNDTVFITKTVTKTEFIEGEIRYITKKDKRIERRQIKKRDNRDFKLAKKELGVEKVKARKSGQKWWDRYWLGFLTCLVIVSVIYYLYRRFFHK
jgi:hypothetical protein